MWNTFKYTVLSLAREKNILIWALAFPILLATIFNFMFANLDESTQFSPVPVAVVADANYEQDPSFAQVIESVSEEGDSRLLETVYASSEGEAQTLLSEGEIEGYITLDSEGVPFYFVGTLGSSVSAESVNRTIIKNFLDTYVQDKEVIANLVTTNPSLLTQPDFIESLLEQNTFTEQKAVTANDPSGAIRYFYVLLGFSALMASTIGLTAISTTLANTSALGARRTVGATSKLTTLIATLLACWLLCYCCLLIAFAFIKYVCGVDFGGKDAACLLGLLVASLVSTALGSVVGALPKLGLGAKSGIMTGLTCFLALFAGLYGEASMQLADRLARVAPFSQIINPSKQIADLFYSLYYYDTYGPYFEALVILLITAGVLFVGAALLMRRQRHASI